MGFAMIRKITGLRTQFEALSLDRKFYAAAGFIFACYFLSSIPLFIFAEPNLVQSIASVTAPLSLSLLTAAVLVESTRFLEKMWERRWFKLLVAFLTFVAFSLARAHADKFINTLTSLDPSVLPQAQILLTSLLLVPSWVSVLLVILLLLMIVTMIFIPGFAASGENELTSWLRIGRVLGLMGVFTLLAWIDSQYKNDHSLVNSAMKEAVIYAEYHSKTPCRNVASDSLVADIGRGYISVFSRTSLDFHVENCVLIGSEATGGDAGT
jgi:hypothetical protein